MRTVSFPDRRLGRARTGAALAVAATLAGAATIFLGGCETEPKPAPTPKNIDWQLPVGEHGLRKLSRDQYPDLAAAFKARDQKLATAVDRSVHWFTTGISSQRYATDHLGKLAEVVGDHDRAASSVVAFRDLLARSTDAKSFQDAVYEQFEIWQSRGYDDQGTVFFTGYYSPELKASPVRTETFKYPLFKRPKDLATDSVTGEPLGRRGADGSIAPWPSRKDLLASNAFAGNELIWLPSAFDVYLCEVNGSAKLVMPDNTVKYVGYAGKTGLEYVGLGKSLVDAGVIEKRDLSLPTIQKLYEKDPALVQQYMDKNLNMVFFSFYDGKIWPSGSLGFPVTEQVTLATDKKIFPPGMPVLVNTQAPDFAGRMTPFNRFMLDQDTGGGIRTAGRADIFMGIGAAGGILAGSEKADGTFYYFVLKPEYASKYPPPQRLSTPSKPKGSPDNAMVNKNKPVGRMAGGLAPTQNAGPDIIGNPNQSEGPGARPTKPGEVIPPPAPAAPPPAPK
jgi:membrane-bound lytic murein transglycosylase A